MFKQVLKQKCDTYYNLINMYEQNISSRSSWMLQCQSHLEQDPLTFEEVWFYPDPHECMMWHAANVKEPRDVKKCKVWCLTLKKHAPKTENSLDVNGSSRKRKLGCIAWDWLHRVVVRFLVWTEPNDLHQCLMM